MAKHVEIVIPVRNNIHLTKQCVESIKKYTKNDNYSIHILDNNSNLTVQNKLIHLNDVNIWHLNDNLGFAKAINTFILDYSKHADYICIMNNDVLVTEGWLDKLILALESEDDIKAVSPLTNSAFYAYFPLVSGWSYHQFSEYLATLGKPPVDTILECFCCLFDKDIFYELGLFDETYFFYGEDTDFWMRMMEDGRYRSVLDFRTYVYHKGSGSKNVLNYGEKIKAQIRFTSRYKDKFEKWSQSITDNLNRIKQEIFVPIKPTKRDITWLVKSLESCGAVDYITDAVNFLLEKGHEVNVVVDASCKNKQSHPNLRVGPYFLDLTAKDSLEYFYNYISKSGVVLTHTDDLQHANFTEKLNECSWYKVLHHYQSYEQDFITNIQTIEPGRFEIISASQYVSNKLKDKVIATIEPGVNTDIFYEDLHSTKEKFSLALSADPRYWFKGLDRVKQILHHLNMRLHFNIYLIGIDHLPGYYARCMGRLSTEETADLFRKVDLFIDPSYYHSYGLMPLEALACGCKVLCWDNGGSTSSPDYTSNSEITVLEKSASPEQAARWVLTQWGLT